MTSLVLTLTETLRYKGALGQWSWVLHRITGLGVVLFLTLHVVDTSWAVFYPALYVEAIATYQTPLFTIGEFGLVACVVYHALNGLRIAIIDFKPVWWKYQQRAAVYVLGGTAIILVPVFILMFNHVLHFYGDPESQYLGLAEVINAQLPFVAGFAVAIIAALLLSAVYGLVAGAPAAPAKGVKHTPHGSQIERFWWSFMRASGILIVPLVFGHLAMMHIVQGVFDITLAGGAVVGTTTANVTGTSVEFVANRWGFLVAGVAIWRVYDFALLAMVVIHGFNGLRLVLTDYTTFNPFLKRASVYLCLIAAVTLLVLGGLALLSTIDSGAIEMAQHAAEALHQ
ncbi:MAG: succinate dehydrogenase, cytochrome b556 subunit [Chloroflexi bacterium]|nr:succinate dehydrogenase, cytochrome b556 subunit [Chloroflexota bacterium]MCC6895096.1 succinate dehydrogenase, cytochrome b556 subunit [Anaerolineae bacterium]